MLYVHRNDINKVDVLNASVNVFIASLHGRDEWISLTFHDTPLNGDSECGKRGAVLLT